MASVRDRLSDELRTSQLVREEWHRAFEAELAAVAASRVDWRSGRALPALVDLDDSREREDICASRLNVMSIDVVARILKQSVRLNKALVGLGLNAQSTRKLRSHIEVLVHDLSQKPSTYALSQTSPFPAIWPRVADRIAADVWNNRSGLHEWAIMNGLLIAEHIRTWRWNSATTASRALEVLHGLLGVRSKLTRLPQRFDSTGLVDYVVPIVSVTSTMRLATAASFELVATIERAALELRQGNGFVHQILDVTAPPPADAVGVFSSKTLAALRSAKYAQIEHLCIAYLSLCCIEQILRAWAEHQGVPHLKDGQPRSWSRWGQKLLGASPLQAELNQLYDPAVLHIRGRMMHGGLFDAGTLGAEFTVATAHDHGVTTELLDANLPAPYSASNVSAHCLRVLQAEDKAAPPGVLGAHRSWESKVALSDAELEFGVRVTCDFLHPNAEHVRRQLFTYLHTVAPGVDLFAKVGFVGWANQEIDQRSPVLHRALIMCFESLYRMTAHMLGIRVLQLDDSETPARVQYRVLDSRENGLCSSAVTSRLVEHLPDAQRDIARTVVRLAVRARNASAHGAMPPITELRWRGEGHIIIKAIQLLMGAGLHHMTREAAYYEWISNISHGRGEDSARDWIAARTKVTQLIFSNEAELVSF